MFLLQWKMFFKEERVKNKVFRERSRKKLKFTDYKEITIKIGIILPRKFQLIKYI